MKGESKLETDVLVIGGGMAGLFSAIKAKEEGVEVILVDKNYVSRSGSTAFAEGEEIVAKHPAICKAGLLSCVAFGI